MSHGKRFDYMMVALDVGGSRKYRRLTPAERWAALAGVWALAGKSPVSGALLIAYGVEATADDVAEQAGVPVAVARCTLSKLKDLAELVRDEALGAWVIEDWTSHQPAPRGPKPSDAADQSRIRKQRQRERVSRDVTPRDMVAVTTPLSREVTTPEVNRSEVEGKKSPLNPPPSGGRKRQIQEWENAATSWAIGEGLNGTNEVLLRAVRQAQPWRHPDPAGHFRAFAAQHFARSIQTDVAA